MAAELAEPNVPFAHIEAQRSQAGVPMKCRRFEPTHVLKLSSNSEILIACPDERSALGIARKIAEKTGCLVTVSDAERRPLGSVAAPTRH
jgi:hypothetical protein